jgi:hypothetical protein
MVVGVDADSCICEQPHQPKSLKHLRLAATRMDAVYLVPEFRRSADAHDKSKRHVLGLGEFHRKLFVFVEYVLDRCVIEQPWPLSVIRLRASRRSAKRAASVRERFRIGRLSIEAISSSIFPSGMVTTSLDSQRFMENIG